MSTDMSTKTLDLRVAELAARDRDLAVEILAEAIRIPSDYVDLPKEEGGDPLCGLSNHEGPRLKYLRDKIIEIGAVRNPEDVYFDAYGNIVWHAWDPTDGIAMDDKRVIYMDGHTDTVKALRHQWIAKIGGGIDAYDGVTDMEKVDREFLRKEMGYLPPDDQWDHLVFGRGSADQLSGVISQIIATRILIELTDEGALKGAIIRSYGTAAEEDNDGAGPMYIVNKILPGAALNLVPDVVILSEGTGDASVGSLGIYRGQRGRMQIEVQVTGRSCHGSMPWEGLNPLEFGAAIIVEAGEKYKARDGFLDDEFLGHGTQTASWATLESPSDCAVPDRFTFRFDRRLTIGEDPKQCIADIDTMSSVAKAREAGLTVTVDAPFYDKTSWTGYNPGNPQIYPGWATPEDHKVIKAAVETYTRVVTPSTEDGMGNLRKQPRVSRWIFSTDGVGFPVPKDDTSINVTERKDWITAGPVKFPPMFGIGPGIEQNTHKIGECVDARELERAIAFMARFPAAFVALG